MKLGQKLLIFLVAFIVIGLVLFGLLRYRHNRAANSAHPTLGLHGVEFEQVMQSGRNYLDQSQGEKALPLYQKAITLNPTHPDARINLAICYLMRNQAEAAFKEATEAVNLERNSAAAHYLVGCAQLRLGKYEPAIQAFQNSLNLDSQVAAAFYQMAMARVGLGQLDDAASDFREAISLQPEHPVAHFQLSQALNRLGQSEAAAQEMEKHGQIKAKSAASISSVFDTERCKHTIARLPLKMEQPAPAGIKVIFREATHQVFGDTQRYQGPVGILDAGLLARNSLFVREAEGFRLLANSNGVFNPIGNLLPFGAGGTYRCVLVGDINNDQVSDVVVLGEKGSHVFRFDTNARVREVTALTGLSNLPARDGVMWDFDYTGKLDLLTIAPDGKTVTVNRNQDNFRFRIAQGTGISSNIIGVQQIVVEDFNGDDIPDLLFSRAGQPLTLFHKQRGGVFTNAALPAEWPAGTAVAACDLDNDLRPDLVCSVNEAIEVLWGGTAKKTSIPNGNKQVLGIKALDYDNDGWLDLVVWGSGIRIWRNVGNHQFLETTAATGISQTGDRNIISLDAADFDSDGDRDLIAGLSDGRLIYFRNDGGDQNQLLKLQLQGNRSNANGIGVRVDLAARGLRLTRRLQQLPLEIGVGKHSQVDSLTVNWFDLTLSSVDIKVENQPLQIPEIVFPKGSCPYVYAWDGQQFRFVSDFLSGSPLGLPVAEKIFVDADAREYVWIGNNDNFVPKDGKYLLQITEELSEALYLDEAKLVAVDHPVGTSAFSTCKMVPMKPFPPAEIAFLKNPLPATKATRNDGVDLTEALQTVDGKMAGPASIHIPQLRGQAEPWSISLTLPNIDSRQTLVMALTGWIRFGGGMGNIAASRNPDLPFPFPKLEAENGTGQWQPVDEVVGTPAGKTKTILVDLTGKLPVGTKSLRLSLAFEIYWDAIVLYEKTGQTVSTIISLTPDAADLHYRGYSVFKELPSYLPLTPDYDTLLPIPHWNIIPEGWCTRYGGVKELLEYTDNSLVIVNGGDELSLSFPADKLPPLALGMKRDFFLYSTGWDKDTDFHIAGGTTVEPLPWHGLNDQRYGIEKRPQFSNDAWIKKYNTRWVDARVLRKSAKR